ncbi:MAG TPA: hypothetical protein VIM14_15170 [Polyangia bacterium]
MSLIAGVALALFVGIGAQATPAHAAKKESAKSNIDARELQAREAFASGHYAEALQLYAKLYAERLHPTYLRNIGRCHQNLGEADEAITSFRDYLRKAPKLSSAEREEVDGFIKEMEAIKAKQRQDQDNARQAAAAQTAPTPPAQTPVDQRGGLVAGQAGAVSALPVGADLSRSSTPEASPPVYKRAWFWVAVGTVVAAGVVGALWAEGAFKKSAQCPAGRVCL